ncbi:uncharacterized protein J4E79_001593 [Alternaria viburni]|uniref:uncharacterized protein n=1 Tax=Alternaria viburni TaxID=566460 RepID=UPI0020C35811|nr:uncharacterized protein J4E79_001593 [Alternaria viburni]KAI4669548.1 hypothetical protein J4E79_001593 [Alternaria viburni]
MVEGGIIDLFNFKGALVRDSVKVVIVDFERDGGADIRSVKLIEQYWSFAFGYPKVSMEGDALNLPFVMTVIADSKDLISIVK